MTSDHVFELNFAVTLLLRNQVEAARQHFEKFEKLFQELDEETRNADPEVVVSGTLYCGTDNPPGTASIVASRSAAWHPMTPSSILSHAT